MKSRGKGSRGGKSGGRRAVLLGPIVRAADLRAQLRALKRGSNDLRVGIDGGVLLWQSLGIQPDLAIGDWDSLRNRKVLRDLLHVTLPSDKDRSDLHYAIQAAVNSGVKEVVCLGVSGGRPDHHQAMLFDLMEAASHREFALDRVMALGSEARYDFLGRKEQELWLDLKPGSLVSVFSFSDVPAVVSLEGFRYELDRAKLLPSSHGLSNVATSKAARIRLHAGKLLVVTPAQQRKSKKSTP